MGGRGGGKIMPVVVGRGWRRKIRAGRGCSWVVVAKLWLVVDGRGWSHDLIMPIRKSIRLYLLKTCFLYITPAK